MFTIKLYMGGGWRQRIYEAESFTVLREYESEITGGPLGGHAEITAHLKGGESIRFDIGDSPYEPAGGKWEKAIIENAAGRTTEIIGNHIPQPRAAKPVAA